MHTPGGGAGSGRGDTLGAVVGGPRGTAEVKAQRVLEGTPLGWAGGSGLQQQGGGSPQQRRRRMKAGDDGLAGSARRLLGVFPANSWLTPRRLGRETIPHPRQPPGAGTAGRDHGAALRSSAQLGRDPAAQPGAQGSRDTGNPHVSHYALSPPSPPCAQGNCQSSSARGHMLQPCSAKDGQTPARRVVASWLELGTCHGPGRGCPCSTRDRTQHIFPCSQGAMRHPRTPQFCSFCFPLRLFIGNF